MADESDSDLEILELDVFSNTPMPAMKRSATSKLATSTPGPKKFKSATGTGSALRRSVSTPTAGTASTQPSFNTPVLGSLSSTPSANTRSHIAATVLATVNRMGEDEETARMGFSMMAGNSSLKTNRMSHIRSRRQDILDADSKLARQLYKERIEGATLIKVRQPKKFKGVMLPHQLMALTWLTSHEFENGGGVFCDDQGLGKTIMLIGLILANTAAAYRKSLTSGKKGVAHVRAAMGNGLSLVEERKYNRHSTLIVVPLSTLDQWKAEIEKFSDGSLQVLRYYGPERDQYDQHDFQKADVVVTTYQTLTVEVFPRKTKAEREVIKKKMKLKYGHLSQSMFRERFREALADRNSPFLQTKWLRFILDESHVIRNPATLTNKAIWQLDSAYRWCASGTPIHNKLRDVYSQIALTQVPHLIEKSKWKELEDKLKKGEFKLKEGTWKEINKTLSLHMLRRLKTSRNKRGLPLVPLPQKYVTLKRISLSPKEAKDYKQLWEGCKEMFQRYENAEGGAGQHMTSIFAMLCRLRQFCDHPALVGIGLGRKFADMEELYVPESVADDVEVMKDEDDEGDGEESDQSDATVTRPSAPSVSVPTEVSLRKLLSRGINLAQKQNVPEADVYRSDVKEDKLLAKDLKTVEDTARFFETEHERKVREGSTINPLVEDWTIDTWQSSKVSALLEDLVAMKEKDPLSSAIVFSQFTMFLDILEIVFKKLEGFRFTRIDGSINQDVRVENIKQFRDDYLTNVFLISTKAGGVGLNLMAADHVFILDPWWNPALEHQAIDRVHRIGQSRPVHVIRYFIHSSVEEQILHLQEKKERMAAGAFGESKIGQKLLSVEEVTQLFKTGKKHKMGVRTDQNVGDSGNDDEGQDSDSEDREWKKSKKKSNQYLSDSDSDVSDAMGYEDLEAIDVDAVNKSDYYDESKQAALRALVDAESLRTFAVACEKLRPMGYAYHSSGIPSLRELAARHILGRIDEYEEKIKQMSADDLETLTKTCAKYVPTSEEFLESILSVGSATSITVRGDKVQSIRPEMIVSIPEHLPELEELTLIDLPQMMDIHWKPLIESASAYLRVLNLSSCGRFVDDNLATLIANECAYLEVLKLDNAYRLTNINSVLQRRNPTENLRELSFEHCSELHLGHWQWDTSLVSHLTKLNISHATKLGLTANQVSQFGKQAQDEDTSKESAKSKAAKCPGAENEEEEELDVHAEFAENRILGDFFKDCLDLTELDMAGQAACNLTNYTLAAIASNLYSLEVLNMSGCEDIDAAIRQTFLQTLSESATKLRVLDISRCFSLSNLDAISNFPELVELRVGRLSRVGDGNIDTITMSCRKLEKLSVNTCNSLTSVTVQSLVNNLGDTLMFLDVSWTKILDENCELLEKLLVGLRKLRHIKCWGVMLDHQKVKMLQERFPKVYIQN